MRLVALLVVAGCDAGIPPPETPGPPAEAPTPSSTTAQTPAPITPIADGAGGWYVVLDTIDVQHECTGAGGMHATLEVMGATDAVPRFVHAGGHGRYFPLRCGQRFVARITQREAKQIPGRIGPPCIEGQPLFDGAYTAIKPIEHSQDARAELERVARDGLPAGELETWTVGWNARDARAPCRLVPL